MSTAKRCIALCIALLLLGTAACTPQPRPEASPSASAADSSDAESTLSPGEISQEQLITALLEKYSDTETATYLPAQYGLPRGHTFQFEIGFEPLEKGYERFDEIISVYQDPQFTRQVGTAFDVEQKEPGYTFTLKPGRTPALSIASSMYEAGQTTKLGDGDYILFDKGQYSDWGNLSQYYLVQWVDLQTGEKLAKPVAQVFTLKTELETPKAQFYVAEDGSAAFRWDAVAGAEEYYVVRVPASQTLNIATATVVARTADTSWVYDNSDQAKGFNGSFITYVVAEDDLASPQSEAYQNILDTAGEHLEYLYGVVAVSSSGTSSAGHLYHQDEIAPLLPHALAYATIRNEGEYGRTVASIGLMPAQAPLTMCDGRLIKRTILYDVDRAAILPNGLSVPFQIAGTPFSDTMLIEHYDESWQVQLQEIAARQAEMLSRAGTAGVLDFTQKEAGDTTPGAHFATTADKVVATNALSEYLAANMLAANEVISLVDFPQSSDQEYLIDAWNEAVYQNPLALGVRSAYMTPQADVMVIEYDDDAAVMAAKQQEIRDAVQKITAEIIIDSMTDLEKEIAINDYLCETAEYDMEALENAESNNFQSVDAPFRDSFTPYGILIRQKGVCSSYAGAFHLLAQQAGLESIVVTGYLEGLLPHAWNRVHIDGEWRTVDVTNNDNPLLLNALLNLPDDAAALALVEDDLFLLNQHLAQYTASDSSKEYYRVTERYYPVETVSKELAHLLQTSGSATLRTDYALDDDAFRQIAQSVMGELQIEGLYGYHWMGVVTMSLPGTKAGQPEEQPAAAPAPADTALSADILSGQVSVDGALYTLPAPYADFRAAGWGNPKLDGLLLKAGAASYSELVRSGEHTFYLSFYNPGTTDSPVEDCFISKVSIDEFNAKSGVHILLPQGIGIGSHYDEVIAAYGAPAREETIGSTLTVQYGADSAATVRVKLDTATKLVKSFDVESTSVR